MDHLLEFGILFSYKISSYALNQQIIFTYTRDYSENGCIRKPRSGLDSSPPSSSQYRIGDAAEQERQEGADKGQYVEGHGEVG